MRWFWGGRWCLGGGAVQGLSLRGFLFGFGVAQQVFCLGLLPLFGLGPWAFRAFPS